MSREWILTCCFFILLFGQLDAQSLERELTATSGDSYSGSNLLIDWSLGELSIESNETTNLILSQGFHQPGITFLGFSSEIRIATSMVYPNPCLNQLNYTLTSPIGIRSIQVINASGILVESLSNLTDKENSGTIDFKPLSSGTYILKIDYRNGEQDVHRVIKY